MLELSHSTAEKRDTRLEDVRAHCAWIVENYGPTLRADEKSYGSTHDVLVGRLILAEDVLRIIDGDNRE